jgi:hypothetical protein
MSDPEDVGKDARMAAFVQAYDAMTEAVMHLSAEDRADVIADLIEALDAELDAIDGEQKDGEEE